MKKVSLNQLGEDVARLLGESLQLECHTEECPFPELSERAGLLAPECLASLIKERKREITEGWKKFPTNPVIDGEGVATLPLPSDFLCLGFLKMSDWRRGITELFTPDSAEASRQASPHPGIKGNPERPVGVLGLNSDGYGSIFLYSSSASSRLETGLYWPMPFVSGNSADIPELLYGPLLEKIAEKIREMTPL